MTSRSNDRITIAALRYYVPIYQNGEQALMELIENSDSLSPAQRNSLETRIKLSELTMLKVAQLSGPLITREINKMIATSHLRTRDDLFSVLYFAGVDGMKRGMRKFEVDKINVSSTNYLFQWFVTYAKKELLTLEAPFGIPPSRFQVYKKVSAVRKKLTESLERPITNEEIFEYFQSGQADLKTFNGRVGKKSVSQANQNVTMQIIVEQEDFEKKMMNVGLIDPQGDRAVELGQRAASTRSPFNESVFGVFVANVQTRPEAIAVLKSTLDYDEFSDAENELLHNLDKSSFRKIQNQWKNVIQDVNGPFYNFLKHNVDAEFEQFDVRETMRAIELGKKIDSSSAYQNLFDFSDLMEVSR